MVLILTTFAAAAAMAAAPPAPMLHAPAPNAAARTESANTHHPVLARTASGQVAGRIGADQVRVFQGIPYAAPPVGDLRWRAPQPLASWTGVRPATDYGTSCVQLSVPPRLRPPEPVVTPERRIGEDCLYLNVWAPKGAKNLPVMVAIHGGGFILGSGAAASKEGTRLAHDGKVVVVSINYRLGAFGFFAHPELTAAAKDEPATNFGLLDQIAALQWVKRNIASFGGNPGNVTIFGASAGGSSVNLLMVSPLSKGLFHRAISASVSAWQPMRHLDHPVPTQPQSGEQWGQALGTSLGASNLAALRAMPADAILQASLTMGGYPGLIIDRKSLTMDLLEAFRTGRQHKVPYLNGANDYEGGMLGDASLSPAQFDQLLGERRAAVLRAYDPDGTLGADVVRRMVFGDTWLIRPTQTVAANMKTVGLPGYSYVFAYVPKSVRAMTHGSWHGGDTNYLFGTLAYRSAAHGAVTAMDRDISRRYQAFLVQFARTGRPGHAGGPEWKPAAQGAMVFTNTGPRFDKAYLAERMNSVGNAIGPRN